MTGFALTTAPVLLPALGSLSVLACLVVLRLAVAATDRSAVRRRLPAPQPAATQPALARLGLAQPALAPAASGARVVIASHLTAALKEADLSWDADRLSWWWVAAAVAVPATGSLLGGLALAVLFAAAVVVVPVALLRGARHRSCDHLRAALPEALESAARSLRSGASLGQALEEMAVSQRGPLSVELARVQSDVRHGSPLVSAIEELQVRCRLPEIGLVVAALCLGHEAGGAHARALDGLATTLRDNMALAAEVRALSSQARISALVIGLAPVGFAAFSAAADQHTGRFLFGSAGGRLLLGAGLVLDCLGWLWMRRLCRLGPEDR